MKYVIPAVLAVVLMFSIYTGVDNAHCHLTVYEVSSQNLPAGFDGFRVMQLSDLHDAEFGRNNEELIALVSGQQPDIIAITGDLSEGEESERVRLLVSSLADIAPVYYITGNHEYYHRGEPLTALLEAITEGGGTVLRNTAVQLDRNGEQITLAGIDDASFFHMDRKGRMEDALIGLLSTPGYHLLLAHRPEYFSLYAQCGADLTLSGHAHGGQVRLPFIGGLYAPQQGLFPEYDAGVFTQGTARMVVSRGLGGDTFIPRVNNAPEAVLVILRKTAE